MNKHSFLRAAALGLALMLLFTLLAGCKKQSAGVPDAPDGFYVLDEADVLSAETESYIRALNASLNAQCGAQLVVVCVNTTGTTDIADYAEALFNKWKIGDSKKNNGVLLLLSIGEKDYWAVQGKGLEELLPSGTLKLTLNRSLEADFAAGQYEAGVRSVFDDLISQLARIYSVTLDAAENDPSPSVTTAVTSAETNDDPPPQREKSSPGILVWVIILVAVILIIAAVSGGGGGGGGYRRRRRRRYATIYPRPIVTPPRPHQPPRPGSPRPGGYSGGPRPGGSRPGGFSGGSRPGGFSGGSRPGGFSGGSRPGGGGGFTRGGGAGRR